MADLSKIVDELSSLTVLEAAELSKMLEEKWGVSAAAPVAAAAAPAARGGAAAGPAAAGPGGRGRGGGRGGGGGGRPPPRRGGGGGVFPGVLGQGRRQEDQRHQG